MKFIFLSSFFILSSLLFIVSASEIEVDEALKEVIAEDNELNIADIDYLREWAGSSVNFGESRILLAALAGEYKGQVFKVTKEALKYAQSLDLSAADSRTIQEGKSYGGSKIPQAVLDILTIARFAGGAVAYDVAESDYDKNGIPKFTDSHSNKLVLIEGSGTWETGDYQTKNGVKTDDDGQKFNFYNNNLYNKGVWTPHFNDYVRASGAMSFSHTEITPFKLQEDIVNPPLLRNYIGDRNGSAQYSAPARISSGNISSHYDEIYHSDHFARGRSNQRWANNYAIMSDGSLHCLPAMRRSGSAGIILTNQSLDRGKRLLVNGHITVRNGVVTDVGISGRLHKYANKGKHSFINPVAILKAWGFKVSPRVNVRMEGSHGEVLIDEKTYTVREKEAVL
jgi:hypothetical protein